MKQLLVVTLLATMQMACATGPTPALRGTTWVLAAQGDERQAFIVLDPSQQRLSGQAQCNRLMGAFTLDGNRLAFGQVASTRRACIPDDGSEQRFLQALAQVRQWRIEGNELVLLGEGAAALLRLKAGKAP